MHLRSNTDSTQILILNSQQTHDIYSLILPEYNFLCTLHFNISPCVIIYNQDFLEVVSLEHIYVDNGSKKVDLVGVLNSKYSYCASCFKKLDYVGKRGTFCPECLEVEKEKGPKKESLAFLLSLVPGWGYVYIGEDKKALITTILTVAMFFIPVIGWLLSFVIYLISIGNTVKTAKLINEVRKQA